MDDAVNGISSTMQSAKKTASIVMEQLEITTKGLIKKYTKPEKINKQAEMDFQNESRKDQFGIPIDRIETTYGGKKRLN